MNINEETMFTKPATPGDAYLKEKAFDENLKRVSRNMMDYIQELDPLSRSRLSEDLNCILEMVANILLVKSAEQTAILYQLIEADCTIEDLKDEIKMLKGTE